MMDLQPSTLLIVDDDSTFRRALATSLSASGFTVREAGHGAEALSLIRQHTLDLVLLDINMPGIGGIEVCRQLRGLAPQTGIVMVTVGDAEHQKVEALEAGADDYVTKPVALQELVARLRAVYRRIRGQDTQAITVTAGSLLIDLKRRLLRKEGETIHLSPKEFDLLAFMMKNQDVPLTHAKLLRTVWGPEFGSELEYLRSYVRMLRKKIERDPAHPEYILTEPWVGYRFQNPLSAESTSPPPLEA